MTATDMRTLGRLGEPLRSTPGFRRRRRIGRPVAITVAVVLVALLWLGTTANEQLDTPAGGLTTDVSQGRRASSASRGADATTAPFAAVDGLRLVLPHHQPVVVGFHEADGAQALPLEPTGRLLHDANPTGWTPVRDRQGPGYYILPPAGYARPGTGAADVVLPQGGGVLAPVSGRITAVEEYPLMGSTHDWRIVIEPEGRPDLAVYLRYLSNPVVTIGDVVVAGETPLASGRVLPFESAIDAVADVSLPRVMVQVKPAVTSEVDPNAPAVTTSGTES